MMMAVLKENTYLCGEDLKKCLKMKRTFINQIVLTAAFALAPLFAHAYVFEADGIYYNITSLSDLTVEVTYETTNYNSYSGKITIPDTVTYNGKTYAVTSIGEYAFRSCSHLTSITIPDAVTSIGSSAFYNCTSLTSVTIGDAVTSIGNYAFYYCTSLASVTIPDAVTSIGEYAFRECSSLTSVTIGDAVTSIGKSAFSYCSHLTNIICSGTVPPTCASTSCFSNYDATLHVPTDAVETYASTSVWKKFATILGYTELPIFEDDGINYIITSHEDLEVEVSAGDYTGEITIPETVTYSGKTYAVTSIGEYAFYNCSSLTSVTIGDAVTSIGSYAFRNCSSLTSVTIGDAVTSIGSYAFYYCRSLTSITIPDAVTSIGSSAFYNCSILTSVTIGDAVTSIGSNAFYNCSNLTKIICCNETPPQCDGTSSFDNYNATLYVPVDAVDTYAATEVWGYFATILGYTELPIFEDDGINYIITSYEDLEVEVSAGDYTGEITVPETVTYSGKTYAVTSIGEYAFYNCSSLTSVTIGDAVTSIGNYAFYYCSSLASVNIPDAVISIGEYAFSECRSLTSVTIGDAVTSIGKSAFNYCISLTSVTIGDAVTSIGRSAFYLCTSLTSINIPDAVTSIGSAAFCYCSSLTSINIPDAVTSIESSAFSSCTGLTSITIPDAVTSIGSSAFYNCTGLTSVTIGDAVTSIGSSAFNYCSSLADIYSLNITPPTCASTNCFSNYAANLHVPKEAVDTYASTYVWQDFSTIVGDVDSAVESVSVDETEAQPTGYYSLSGQRLNGPSGSGATIIRYSDGTTKKVFVR